MTRLLTARAVSEHLGVSPETVLRWTRRGKLPGHRLPSGAIRYRQDDLEAWLEAHMVGHGAVRREVVGLRTVDNGESEEE